MHFRVGFLIALVVIGAVAGAGPVATAEPDRLESESLAGHPEEVDADETRLDISLQSDGTAEWTVEFWVRLDDNESVDAFESISDDIDDDPDTYTRSFAERIGSTLETAADATEREMSADEFAVETSRQSLGTEYGVVRYTFRWHGFAATDGDQLHAGDAIEGIYLDDGTRLAVDWPATYELVSVTPEPDDQRAQLVIWHGSETDFVSGEPRIVVSTGGIGFGGVTVGAALAVIGALGIGALWWYRSRSSASNASVNDGDRPAASVETGDTEPHSEAAPKPDPRNNLLSNEEQVLQLLEEYDGRVKQQTVVEELEWTDAKTSKVVTGLRDEGKLESFRLGRENVLSLPTDDDGESDPTEARNRSP